MLNTKSIKKTNNLLDISENTYKNDSYLENKRIVDIENTNKILETNDSISSKEILKLHNQNLNNKQNIEENNISLKANTLEEDNLINNELKGGFNPLNILQQKPQIIVVAPKNILSDKIDNIYAKWDEEKNSFLIYNNNEIVGYFNNNDILNSIFKGTNQNKHIKKYFFLIAYNKETETFEFNFLDSIFTDNLDLIIKVQNTLFDVINQNNTLIDDESEMNNLLAFNYQFIIFLFKKNNYLNNNETNKVAKFYSTITFRYSSLILKNIMKIEDKNISIVNDIAKLIEIKKEISQQILKLENSLNDIKTEYTEQNKNIVMNSSDNATNIINISTSDNGTSDASDKTEEETEIIEEVTENEITEEVSETNEENTEKNNLQKGSSNKGKNTVLDEIISSLSGNQYKNKYNSNKNSYMEINDDVTSYLDIQDITNRKSSISSSINKNSYKIANKYTTTDPSYNKSSAIKNGQIYKINI
jgi:hypothetical protein